MKNLFFILATCTVVAFISEYAEFEKTYYEIPKIKGQEMVEIFNENSNEFLNQNEQYILYQEIERK